MGVILGEGEDEGAVGNLSSHVPEEEPEEQDDESVVVLGHPRLSCLRLELVTRHGAPAVHSKEEEGNKEDEGPDNDIGPQGFEVGGPALGFVEKVQGGFGDPVD